MCSMCVGVTLSNKGTFKKTTHSLLSMIDYIPLQNLTISSRLQWLVMCLFPVFSCQRPMSLASCSKSGSRFSILLVIGDTGNSWSDVRRRAILLQRLGTGGQRLFYSFLDTETTYDTAMMALVNYFLPKTNVVAERHAFRKRA